MSPETADALAKLSLLPCALCGRTHAARSESINECLDAAESRLRMQEQELADLRLRVAAIPAMQQCSTCCGTPHASGLPCICDGKNTRDAEVNGLRIAALASERFAAKVNDQLNCARDRIRQLEAAMSAARRVLEVG